MQTPQFKGTALVRIDQGKINLVQDVTVDYPRPGFKEFYATQTRVLTSRTLVRRTMDQLDIWTHPLFHHDLSAEADATKNAREKHADKLRAMLQVRHVRDTQLVEVSFVGPDPELAAKLANALVDQYIAFNAEAESGVARNTTTFIQEQIEKLQQGIQQKEALLQEYGEEQDIVVEQKEDILAQQLSELHRELTQAQGNLATAEAYYLSLRQSNPGSLPEVFNNRTIQDLQREHAQLEKEYAELAERFQPGWPELQRKRSAMEKVKRRLDIETKSLADKLRVAARTRYHEARNRVNLLENALEEQREETRALNAQTADYSRVKVELESQRSMLQQLMRRQGETGLSAELEERQHINIRTVEEAVVPIAPFKPSLIRNLLLGGFAGIALALGAAFFVNFWDTSICNSEDLRRYVSTPCLAMIPHYSREKQISGQRRRQQLPVSARGAKTTALTRTPRHLSPIKDSNKASYPDKGELVERFKFLRSALLLSTPGNPPKTVLFTSGGQGEGKSFVSCNFASSFTQLHKRVLLIDADLRRPSLHRFFGIKNKVGLTNVITGQVALEEGCLQSTGIPNLFVLLSGSKTPSPAELLSSKAMEGVLSRSAELFDMVVIDSAPLFPVADTHSLLGLSDSVMLIARSGMTKGPAVKSALELIEQAQGKTTGIVLNDVDLSDYAQGYYYRNYSYEYSNTSYREHAQG
jgi:capsular exopolysaccharide synthesis family protein